MYSDLYLQQHSRPSQILVILAVLVAVSSIGYYFLSSSTPTRASKQIVSEHQQVNISQKQAGIFWKVETADEGWIIYGENPSNLSQVALDERDIGQREKRKHHYIVLKNLEPDTTYYYRIISNNELVSAEGNEPFSIRTISDGMASSSMSPAYGKVVSQSGDPLTNNFVIITVNNAYPLLALTKNTGEWLIPLQYIISSTDQRSIPVSEDTIVNIKVFNESQQSIIKATLRQTHPIPQTVVIGNNYTFLEEQVLSANSRQSQTSSYNVDLQYPKNGAVIPGNTPLIRGKGVPGKDVSIQINARPVFSGNTKVDKDGNWVITVGRTIMPGTYTISMTTQDNRNKVVEIKRNFTLIKSGEQVLSESTGSATLTPTDTPEEIQVSPSPTVMAQIPTPTDEVIITDLSPTLTPAPPVSGISMIPFMFAGIGLLLLGAGLVLFL
ncbi:MAG TPA: fibronectin type III domain-containing protein [Candidatus Woesebacteria bacterium]|nr:fibronectin type III domain-containing protein [Candidatus Woesebacteria bacterium]